MRITRPQAVTLILAITLLAGVMAIWLGQSLATLQAGGAANIFLAIGTALGLLGYALVMVQLLLICRVPFIERAWGHDRLSHLHHLVGLTAVGFIAAHPLFMLMAYKSQLGTGVVEQILLFLSSFDYVLQAAIAYVLFIGLVVLSVEIVRRKLRYEWWYGTHLMMYLAIILVFDHQISLGRDFSVAWSLAAWRALFWGVLVLAAWSRFVAPTIRSWRHRFTVVSVIPETHDVTSVVIGGRRLDQFRARAGQFIIVRFLVRGFWWQSHPFSLSEMPKGDRLRISVKAVGDFTERIPQLPVGTSIVIEGPLGRFTAERSEGRPVVLIAGGIGITPLRALFEQLSREGRIVDLVYSARSRDDFALKAELDALITTTARMHYSASDVQGYLTPERIRSLVPDIAQREAYVCGPVGMMDSFEQQLRGLGVPHNRIHTERFRLG